MTSISQNQVIENQIEKILIAISRWLLEYIHFGLTVRWAEMVGYVWFNRFFGLDILGIFLWFGFTTVTVIPLIPFFIILDILIQPVRNIFKLNPSNGKNVELKKLLFKPSMENSGVENA